VFRRDDHNGIRQMNKVPANELEKTSSWQKPSTLTPPKIPTKATGKGFGII